VEQQHHLTDREREQIALEVDKFVRVMSERYGVEPAEVVETVAWVKERRESDKRIRTAVMVAVLGSVISALVIAIWEGTKILLRR